MGRFASRRVKMLSTAVLIVLGLSAFTSLSAGASDSSAEADVSAAGTSIVKVGWTKSVESWNPLTLFTYADYVACSMTHSYLFTYDQDWGGPVKDLARDYYQMVNYDGSMDTVINITQYAYFRNAANPIDTSHPLTANDVKFTFDLIAANPGGSSDMFVQDITAVTVLSEFRLKITTSYPKATLIDDLTSIPILPQYLWSTVAHPLSGINPAMLAGSGPFIFDSQVIGAWCKFVKAPNYHGTADYGMSRSIDFDGIIYTTYVGDVSLVLDMNSGNLDAIDITGSANLFLNSLGTGATVNVIKQAVSENGMCEVAVNAIPKELRTAQWGTGNMLLLDPIVRKALQMTLNKNYSVNTIMFGLPVMADSVIPPGYWHKDISPELPFDPASAKAMLMASGYTDIDMDGILEATAGAYPVVQGWAAVGDELSFRLDTTNTRIDYISIGSAWVAWAELSGIKLSLSIQSESMMVMKWYKADYDVWIYHWAWSPEPLSTLSVWLTSELRPGGNNVQMSMGPWYDPMSGTSAFDENYSMAQETLDRTARKVIVDKLQQWVYDSYAENPPYYDLGLYGFTDERFIGWGDWESHPGRTLTSSLLWTWFDLMPNTGNVPPVFFVGLAPDYYGVADQPITFRVIVYDVDYDPIMINWTFGDGIVEFDFVPAGTTSPTNVTRTHTYLLYNATSLNMHVTAHDGIQGHQVESHTTVHIEVPPTFRNVDFVWYDMFNVPFGEWWETRWTNYHYQDVLTTEYPYLYRQYNAPQGNTKVYSAMRLNVSGQFMPEINMNERPEFLPMFGTERGGTAVIDWYMQYATPADLKRYPFATWDDGYFVILNGTVMLDRQAAMTVLGMQSSDFDDFAAWWGLNSARINSDYVTWLDYEANERLDIWNAYEYALVPMYFDLDAERVGNYVSLKYDTVSWGMELLMARWLHDTFVPAEWWYEDMSFRAVINQFDAVVGIDTAVENAVYAWESNLDGTPCWRWEPMLNDYIPASASHPRSDYDPYEGKTYVSRAPESLWYGQSVPYEYTPSAFNLSAGETLSLCWPAGIQVFLKRYNGPQIPEYWLPMTENVTGTMVPSYTEPGGAVDYWYPPDSIGGMIEFSGPMDMWTWSRYQVNCTFLANEWARIGALPYGIPMVEFRVGEIGSPVLTSFSVSIDRDQLDIGEPTGLKVKALDQYGNVFKQYTGTIFFSSTDPMAVLPPSYTFVPNDYGQRTFPNSSLIFYTQGMQTLYVSDIMQPQVAGFDTVNVVFNTPPVAYFTVDPEYGSTDTLFTVDAGYSYDLESPIMVRWDWESNGIWDTPWSYVRTAEHAYGQFGNFAITLQVKDAGDVTDDFSRVVSVGIDVVKVPGASKNSWYNWTYIPTASGDWTIHVDNYMLRLLELEVTDITGGGSKRIFHQKVNFNPMDTFPTGQISFDPVQVQAWHVYNVEAIAWGRGGSHALVYGTVSPNIPPIADFTFSANGLEVYFDASGSISNNGPIVSYRWYFGDDTTGSGMQILHTYANPGGYVVTLFVTDSTNISSSFTREVYLMDSTSPVANAGPDQFVYGAEYIVLNGSGSVDDVGIVSYEWSFFAGNGELRLYYGEIVTVPSERFFSYGNYTVTLTVRDRDGNFDTDTVAIDFGFKIQGGTGGKYVTAQMPSVDCYWKVKLENSGLTTLIIDILDVNVTGPSQWVYHTTISFVDGGAYPYGWLVTDPILMLAGHLYQIEFSTPDSAGTFAIEYDFLVPL